MSAQLNKLKLDLTEINQLSLLSLIHLKEWQIALQYMSYIHFFTKANLDSQPDPATEECFFFMMSIYSSLKVRLNRSVPWNGKVYVSYM